MTLEERLGHVPGHGVGILPAKRLGCRHDANRTVYHLAAIALGHVSSNLFEVFTAPSSLQLCLQRSTHRRWRDRTQTRSRACCGRVIDFIQG